MTDATLTVANDVDVTDLPVAGTTPSGYTHTDLTYELNRLAGTLSDGHSTLAAQGAANVWASTTDLAILGALNVKNSTTDLGLRAVCNALGSTTNMDPAYALSQIETPS